MIKLPCTFCETINWKSKDGRSGTFYQVEVQLPSGKHHTEQCFKPYEVGSPVEFDIVSRSSSNGKQYLQLVVKETQK